MLPLWSRLRHIPTTIVHGEQDRLVPIGNADFIRHHLPQAVERRLADENHFFCLWRQAELLAEVLIELLPDP